MSTDELNVTPAVVTAVKQRRLAARQNSTPLQALVALATMQKPPRPVLNTVTGGEETALIGQIQQADIYDPVTTALRYVRDGLDAVALFTDADIYSRGMDDLTLLARGVNCPIVYQDYVLSEYHVIESRAAGASAVVAYTSHLEYANLRRVVSATQRWRMTAILQIAEEAAVELANPLSPHVIAAGREVWFDATHDLDLLANLRGRIPRHTRLMPLGSISRMSDLAAVIEIGVDAVVIDSPLLQNAGQISHIRDLLDERD